MKRLSTLCSVVALALPACDSLNQPMTRGDFDPLRAPGTTAATAAALGAQFSAGQFVRAAIDNTAFFKIRPKGNSDADKLIARGTSMKVISHNDNYVKVELDSGEIGFVPSVMLEDPNSAANTQAPHPGEFQIYPPLNSPGQAMPPALPMAQPPNGAIPTVIDPEAPATNGPFAAPPEPATGHAPLPPNGRE